MPVNVNVESDHPLRKELEYTLTVFCKNKNTALSHSNTGLLIGASENATIRISEKFTANFTQQKYSHADNLSDSGFLEHANGTPDYLSTAFYMLSCLQEYDFSAEQDSLDRFKFKGSYQHRFGNTQQNIVQLCFDKLAEKFEITSADKPSRFFLSHDIDTVYGSILEDGFHNLKKGRFDVILKLLFNVAITRPDWLNIDQIMRIENSYDCRSTFFWIARQGKAKGLQNADYNFQSPRFQKVVQQVNQYGFENGIHKSVSTDSFENELGSFTEKPIANRYHYLKFNLPEGFDKIEQAGLKLDASLGFAEGMGFRNSYGQPCNPYNLKNRKPYSFVEVPLHIMDRTFFQYEKISPGQAKEQVINFLERNSKNCVLSILWHNNFFTNYKFKGYLDLYKSILMYIKENNFSTITQKELITDYSIT
jgi:hypothetical protein